MKQSFFSIALILVFFFCLFAQEKEERKEYYKHNRQFLDYNQPFNELNSPYNLKSNTNDVWTELNPKVPRVSYWCTDFVTAEIGWAVGEQGAIIKTTNGGNEWIDVSFNTSADLLRMDSYDGNIVIIAGEGGIILRSDDAGKTWEQISSGVTTQLWTVQM
ncbi:MAG: hypothetical protein KJO59_01570, partial [Ignavibacteria bacterium]|nr:hypothetical protein [Ignavibacteria bacterium]